MASIVEAGLAGTAAEAWDKRWGTPEGRADWIDAHPDVVSILPKLRARGVRTALDLGSGVGRHALLLAENGFSVEAFDGSTTGLDILRNTARQRGVAVGVHHGNADVLPFADAAFDFVLSWNVIYHGNLGDTGRRLAEVWRVLKPGGLFQATMLPTRNINYGRGRMVAPDTFVIDGSDERGHPHFYCNAAVLVALFAGFELVSLTEQEHQKPGSWHWHIIAERRPA